MIDTKIGDKHAADINYCIKPISCGISRYSCQNLRNAEKWGSVIRNYLTLSKFGFSNIRAANVIMGLKLVCYKLRHRYWYSLRQTVLAEYFKSTKNIIYCVKIAQNRSNMRKKNDDFWQFGIFDKSNSVSKFTTGSQRIFETNGSQNMIRSKCIRLAPVISKLMLELDIFASVSANSQITPK